MSPRGTSNSNVRGSSYSRAKRRAYLLTVWQSDRGPGTCRCYRCGAILVEATLTVDRINPGCLGGTYQRHNIRPACGACNSSTGNTLRRKASPNGADPDNQT
jgi:5-methylcytosine-specific restriction endonuclease McrA